MAYQQADQQSVIKRQKQLTQPKVVEQFSKLLGNKADNFLAGLSNAVAQYPDLANTNLTDLITVAQKVATLNLSLVSELGQAYIIPYNNHGKVQAQLQLGYRGIIQLVQNTGNIGRLGGSPVYVGNKPHYNFVFGDFYMENEDFNPYTSDDDNDKKVAGYVAYYYLKNGERVVNYWPIEQVEAHAKKFSKSYKGKGTKGYTPWYNNFDAMAIKTVMKDLLKFAPKSSESEVLIEQDNRAESEMIDVTDTEQHEQPEVIEHQESNEPNPEVEKAETVNTDEVHPWHKEQQSNDDIEVPFEEESAQTQSEQGAMFEDLQELKDLK
ncbi:recombinase [Fructobacillus sp. M2-14]|uniref:Recombinase n=1 Tax=Fructobacillus broussonetiae TaxID=2713173 RepID=A0ABS5QYV3_9LACO|nr:recombinase RecT [Fructobacillus broussonetiae]MBS9338364.1 recombinase [Fructobacillus broussonetiae]